MKNATLLKCLIYWWSKYLNWNTSEHTKTLDQMERGMHKSIYNYLWLAIYFFWTLPSPGTLKEYDGFIQTIFTMVYEFWREARIWIWTLLWSWKFAACCVIEDTLVLSHGLRGRVVSTPIQSLYRRKESGFDSRLYPGCCLSLSCDVKNFLWLSCVWWCFLGPMWYSVVHRIYVKKMLLIFLVLLMFSFLL